MTRDRDTLGVAEPTYFRLTVKSVREETAEARSFVLVPERGEREHFQYRPGQFLTFRLPHADGDILRSYSLSSAPQTDPEMTVCVKRVSRGRGSNWFNEKLIAGSRIEAMRPSGRFVLHAADTPVLLIAGGSGITPCISLLKHALLDTRRRVKLIYANQNAGSVIYRDSLDALERTFGDRFTCRHWLDDSQGYMTPAELRELSKGWELADSYICGPGALMDMAEETLAQLFGDSARILTERFLSPDDPEVPAPMASKEPAGPHSESFRLILDGEEHSVPIDGNQTLLAAALAAGIDVPNSCNEGHCGTCMAHLKSGDVSMASTRALSKRNIEHGLVLACQSRPASPAEILLDFDI